MTRGLRLILVLLAGLCATPNVSAQRLIFATPVAPPQTGFLETFDAMASPRGRGGDLDATRWATCRFNPDAVSTGLRPNHVRQAVIPTGIRSTFTDGIPVAADAYNNPAGELVYPPNDILVQDAAGARSSRLMLPIVIQEYGHVDLMARQPFDFAGRTGLIQFDVDAWAEGNLGTYINLDVTEDPVPCPTFGIAFNEETGPRPSAALFIQWSNGALGGPVTIGPVLTYTDYAMTTVSPSFTVSGVNRPAVSAGKLNHIEVQLSATHLTVYESDYSTDDVTFPNVRKIYEADLSLTFTRGYVHFGIRNHSTTKFNFPFTSVYYWDNLAFDGPALPLPRAYEIPDNTVTGHNSSPPPDLPEYDYMLLGLEVSDGTDGFGGMGRAEGLWNANPSGAAHVSPLSIPGVNISGITSAQLTLNCFAQTITHTATTSWGLKYRFNGGTWRTRFLTATEAAVLNINDGAAGQMTFAIDVPIGDLGAGTNTLDFSSVNMPMDYPPAVMNITLLVHAS